MSSSRPILATWHRGSTEIRKPRRYSRVSTALPRILQLLLLEGQPKDVVQISLADFGTWIADIKISVGGKISIRLEPDYEPHN
jgi:hypothetical protein